MRLHWGQLLGVIVMSIAFGGISADFVKHQISRVSSVGDIAFMPSYSTSTLPEPLPPRMNLIVRVIDGDLKPVATKVTLIPYFKSTRSVEDLTSSTSRGNAFFYDVQPGSYTIAMQDEPCKEHDHSLSFTKVGPELLQPAVIVVDYESCTKFM